jgi:hypothetical protein
MRRSTVQTNHPTTARPDSRTRRRRLFATAACVAVVLLAGLGVKLWLDHRPPSPAADPGLLARYMSGPAFAALPDAQKAPYLDAFRRASDRGELTPQQQRGVLSNAVHGEKDPLRRYFALPRGREREKFLDGVIDEVLKSEKAAKPAPRPEDKGSGEAEDRHLADAMPPEDRARMGQFLQELHDRRVARGVQDDGKFLFPLPQ